MTKPLEFITARTCREHRFTKEDSDGKGGHGACSCGRITVQKANQYAKYSSCIKGPYRWAGQSGALKGKEAINEEARRNSLMSFSSVSLKNEGWRHVPSIKKTRPKRGGDTCGTVSGGRCRESTAFNSCGFGGRARTAKNVVSFGMDPGKGSNSEVQGAEGRSRTREVTSALGALQ